MAEKATLWDGPTAEDIWMLVEANDLHGLKKLLDIYGIVGDEREQWIREFKRFCAAFHAKLQP